MHHQIAGRQGLRLCQEILGPALAFGRADQPVAQHVLFADHRQARCLKPMFQRPDGQVQATFAHARRVCDGKDLGQALILDQTRQPFTRTIRVAGNHNRSNFKFCLNMRRQSPKKADTFLLAFGREITPDAPPRIRDAQPRRLRQGRELDHAVTGDSGLPRGIIQIKPTGRGRFVNTVHLRPVRHRQTARLVLVLDAVPPGQTAGGHMFIQCHGRIWQIIKQRLKMVVEKRHPMLGTLMLAPGTDRLIERIIGASGAELQPVGLAEPCHSRIVQDNLGHRGQFDHIQFFGCALGRRIKAARAVQHIAKQIKPHGPQITGRVDINDAAANGIVARLHHRRALNKAHTDQKGPQRALIHTGPDGGRKRSLAQKRPGRHPLGRCVQRRQQHILAWHFMYQRRQGRHPLRGNVRIGRDPVIGQTIPARKHQHRHVRCEKAQRGLHRGQTLVVPRHVDNGTLLGHLIQNQAGVKAFGRARDGDMIG
mmetsp:Transcript_23829/g.43063  ORF Transcript_23829/g.43063 Transcript_23829/m.43063 type:complete len:481 (-) Transcript_23829:1871-3313(-)